MGLLLGVAVVLGRRLWFFSDDWNILADYHDGGLLEPFNGHLSALPAGLYQLLFHTAGLGSYLPYRLCGLAALALLGFHVARYCLARVPSTVAVLAVAAVMWNSFGATNVMFPFLMNFSIPIAALVAIWWHLDRDSTGHDVAAGAWLAVALATSGLGVMTLAAVVVELAWRREPVRRWLVFLPATSLWVIWWLGHRDANDLSGDVPEVVRYFLQMLWGGTTALAAGSRPGGLVLAAGFVVLVLLAIRSGSFGGRAAGALAAAATFAGLTAWTRLDVVPSIPPDELRYGWTIGAYLVLAAVSMAPARPPGARTAGAVEPDASPSGRARGSWPAAALIVLAGLVLLAGAWKLLDGMRDWTDQVADAAPGLRSVLYATEAAGVERVDPDVVLPLSYVPVTTGAYLRAVADVGSPLAGARASQIGGRADQREVAEEVYFGSVELGLESPPTTVDAPVEGCAESLAGVPGQRIALVPAAEPVAGTATLSLARFATSPARELEVRGGSSSFLALPRDAPVGTRAVVPFVMSAEGNLLLCPP